MDLNCNLNFTEICRCCKRTEPGMTPIFDRSAHPTDHKYPPVKEMLRSIASFNVQENDGLPSLVCTSCLNNIQDAFTFILQLIQINEELSLILARRKQDHTLPVLSQSIYETHQYISTDYMKKENEDMNHSLKVEDMDEPMLNFYQHDCAVSSYENIDLVVKLEQPEQDAAGNVDEPEAAVENEEISNLADPLYHASDEEEKDISLVKQYTCAVNENLSVKDDDDLLMVQICEEMEAFEEIDDLGVGNSIDSSDDTEEAQDEDYQENNEDGNSKESSDDDSSDSSRELGSKQRKTTANPVDSPAVLRCKVCAFKCAVMSTLKRHLVAHSKNKPFTCPKCNLSFSHKSYFQRHSRSCNGEISINALNARKRKSGNGSKPKLVLTLQDLEDPEKMKNFYAVGDVQNNDDDVKVESTEDKGDDEEIETTLKLPTMKCKLCDFTSTYMCNLKRHLLAHTNDKPFACSKCNLKFSRKYFVRRHLLSCNGEISLNALSARSRQQARTGENRRGPRRVVALTLQDLKDPEKIKEFYTEIDDDDVNVKSTEDGGGGGDAEIGESSKLAPMRPMLKCKLCDVTTPRMSDLKRHMVSHCVEQPYACSKCNQAFSRKYYMLRHSRSCNGEMSIHALNALAREARNRAYGREPKLVTMLTLQDLEDPEKLKEFYTEVDVQINDDGDDLKNTSIIRLG